MTRSLTTDQLAQRWGRRPEWITGQARAGGIPGAWKLGHVWRFIEADIEAFEISQKTGSIFALSVGAQRRRYAS